ncbi:MAG: hypothetical protein WC805_02760 [Patescibacteria group bacterium]|jgi:hypothetical protein
MKRKAIYLDASNDLYTTMMKVDRIDAEEVILVIPQSSVLFHSAVNFKILRSAAHRLHKTLAVVTADPKGQSLAQRAGLPAYKDVELNEEIATAAVTVSSPPLVNPDELPVAAREIKIKYKRKLPVSRPVPPPVAVITTAAAATRSSERETSRWLRPKLKPNFLHRLTVLGWVAISLTVLGFVIYLVIPKATINLEISAEPFMHKFQLVLADKNDKEAAGQNVFKGRFVVVEKKLTQTFAATGTKNNGNKAGGIVTIYNYTRAVKPLGLRAQTRLQAPDGQIFKLQDEILISSATVGAGGKLVPGRANVRVEAAEGGTQGNLAAATKFTIPGLGTTGVDMVYGQNDNPFSGATDEESKMISEEDIKLAQDSISKNVFIDAEAELQKQIGRKEELIPTLIKNDIINVVPSAAAGTARDNFDLDIQVRSWTLLPDKGQLDKIMQNTINSVVPANRELTSPTLRGVKIVLGNADFNTHIIDFTVDIDGSVAPKISTAELSESLANRSLKSVEALFNSIPDIISHRITLWPFWVKKMPLLESNIKIDFSYINQ